ncbi:MAG: hypothetical protein AAF616_13500 [Bacteroidota bacterium]
MLKLATLTGLFLCSSLGLTGQVEKFYTIKEASNFDTVEFHLKATATNCLIKKSKADLHPLTIYGNPNLEKINPSFGSKIDRLTCYASLKLDEYNSTGFGDSFSMAVTGSDEENDFWEVDLNNKIYKLNLIYGFGNANIDLTGTAVHRLKIKSGSADINVGYDRNSPNPIKMDTFFVKADFGSITARHMELTHAKNVITKVGFGNVLLDFEKGTVDQCRVSASVGAGNLEIVLPKYSTPVIIRIKGSPLCAVKLVDGYEEVESNVFVNMAYVADATDLLSFDVDVALGMVRFRHAD